MRRRRSVFIRRLPPCRNFPVAAGLEQVLEFLEGLEFTAQELEWLETTGRFRREFLHYLRDLRFTGDPVHVSAGLHALAEECDRAHA
jgi:nicotinate phosphoribosyltransferase